MKTVWHLPTETASAMCNVNLSAYGQTVQALLPHVHTAFAPART